MTDSEQESPSHRRRLAALTALVAVALIAAVVLLTGDDGGVPVAGDTTTVVDPAASTTADAGGTDAPATTETEEPGGVFNTVRVFVTFIRETPGEVLDSSAAEEILSKVADGVSEAISGNDAEAESSLEDAVETVEARSSPRRWSNAPSR